MSSSQASGQPSPDLDALRSSAAGGDPQAQERLGRELVSGAALNSDRFAEGLDWITKAAGQQSIDALILKGHLHCQYPTLPDAPQVAADCYTAAARQGHPEALMRVADLSLFGYGLDRDDSRAFSILHQLCAGSFPLVLCQTAYLLSRGIGCDPDEAAAAQLVLRAAAQGDTLAFVLLAQRYGAGIGVAQRPDIALAWWLLAQRRQFPGADHELAVCRDSLDQGQINAGEALAQSLMETLRGLGTAVAGLGIAENHPEFPARFQAVVAENFEQLGDPALSLDSANRTAGQSNRPQLDLSPHALSWRPRVMRIERFAHDDEVAHLLAASTGLLVDTADQLAAGGVIEVDAFDGACAVFAPHTVTPVVRAIQRRWARVLHLEEQHFEPMSVLRYQEGHEYSPHVDYFDSARMLAHRQIGDLGGQRLITGLIYLIAPEAGGGTRYPAADLTVSGHPGMALFHYNATADGLADPRSLHHGLPIEGGEKWLCRTAARERNLYDELQTVL